MAKKKWQHLRGEVEKFDAQPSERRQEINKEKDGRRDLSLKEIAADYNYTRTQYDETEAILKRKQLLIDALEELMLERMEKDDLESVTVGDRTFSRTDTPYPQVKDKAALAEWIKSEGLDDLLTLNYQTLRGMVSERLLNGEAIPDGVELFLKQSVRRR